MLYFIKRNVKIQEYKIYHKSVNVLVSYFHKFQPREELVQSLTKEIDNKPWCSEITIKEYLKIIHDIDFSDQIDCEVLYTALKKVQDKIKSYEPYEGRIDFSLYRDIFNFENYIYKDKLFRYNTISNSNKRLIPDYISSVFAELIHNSNLSKEIRRNIEQYFFAIMSNMDYINIANDNEIIEELNSSAVNNIYSVIGNIPTIFNNDEKIEFLVERGNCFIDLSEKITPHANGPISVRIDSGIATGYVRFKKNCQLSLKQHEYEANKQTSESLKDTFDALKENSNDYNLIIISSSFHLLKCALEIERHFQRNVLKKPKNILLVGQNKIYDIIKATPKDSSQGSDIRSNNICRKKEIKSLVYEIIMHNLDRNAIK